MTPSQEKVLELIRSAAEAGHRCPTNDEIWNELNKCGLPTPQSSAVSAMAAAGLIKRVDIYGKNWRVVELNDGKRTLEDPNRGEPYRVISAGTNAYMSGSRIVRPGPKPNITPLPPLRGRE